MTSTKSSRGTMELPLEQTVREQIARALERDLANLDAALALGIKLVDSSGEVNCLPGLPERTAKITMALYAKSIKTVRAIRMVSSIGLLEDGRTLCRSLLETCVAIHYLLQKDWEVRSDEYAAYTILKDLTTAHGWRKTKGLKEDGARLELAVKKVIAQHLLHIPPARQEVIRTTGYAGMSLEATFYEVGLSSHYQLAYRAMSSHSHATDFATHFSWDRERGLSLHLGSTDIPEIRQLLHSTRWFFAGIMEIVSKAMGLGYLAAIAKFGQELDDPSEEVLRAWRARREEG